MIFGWNVRTQKEVFAEYDALIKIRFFPGRIEDASFADLVWLSEQGDENLVSFYFASQLFSHRSQVEAFKLNQIVSIGLFIDGFRHACSLVSNHHNAISMPGQGISPSSPLDFANLLRLERQGDQMGKTGDAIYGRRESPDGPGTGAYQPL